LIAIFPYIIVFITEEAGAADYVNIIEAAIKFRI
jgi:hypothetical protein